MAVYSKKEKVKLGIKFKDKDKIRRKFIRREEERQIGYIVESEMKRLRNEPNERLRPAA